MSEKSVVEKKSAKPHKAYTKFIWLAVSVFAFVFGIVFRSHGGEIADSTIGYVLKVLYAGIALFPGIMAAQQVGNERINLETMKKNIGAYFLYYIIIFYLVAAVFVVLWVDSVFCF